MIRSEKKTKKKYLNFIKLLKFIINIIRIEKKNKNLIYLIIIVFFQAIFDVLSIASLIPLIFLFQDKNLINDNINSYLSKFGIQSNLIFNNTDLYFYIPLLVILIAIISAAFRLFLIFKTNNFIENIRDSVSQKLMNNFIYNHPRYDIDTSEIAKSILSEVDQFIIIVFQPTILMLNNLILLLGIIIYLFFTSINASIYSLILLFGFYILFYAFSKNYLNKEGNRSEVSNKGRFKTAIEALNNIKEINIYHAQKFFSNRFSIYSSAFANTNANYNSLTASPKYILEMIVLIAIAYSILIMGVNGKNDFNLLSLLGTFALSAYKAQPALSSVIFGINSIEFGSKIITNIHDKIIYKKIKPKKSTHKYINLGKDSNSSIIIKDIIFNYGNNPQNILYKDFNLEIEFSTLNILMGKSGSGKSTLLNLISGLLEANRGEIIFNTSKYKGKKPIISYMNQAYNLYDTSIAKNIAFGVEERNIDIKKIILSLKKAEIYDYVFSLERNIYENVGEYGNKLSMGQIQRITLARALYFNPDILVLDEPTSSLDIINEKSIIKTILNLSKKITVIMSTHKLFDYSNSSNIKLINLNDF